MEETTAFQSGGPQGFLQHLAGLYTSPAPAFLSILRRRQVWAPLVGLLVLNIAFTAYWLRKVDAKQFMIARMEESGQADKIPPDKREEVLEMQAKFVPIMGWVGGVLGSPIVVLVMAALFLFVFRFFYAGELTFLQSAAIVAWSLLAVGLVTTPLTLLTLSLKGDWTLAPQNALQANLSMFLDKATTAKPLFALAESLDLFSFWVLWLLASGYGVAIRRPTSSAVGGVVALWVIWVLGRMALAALF